MDGLSTPREIAERCKEIDCPCCALTDHGVVAGHLQFAKAMEKEGIKPIFGMEAYHGLKTENFERNERDQAHLVLGALTDEGLKNLWRLSDASASNFRYVPRVNWEMLEKYSEGLYCTSACMSGLVSKEIKDGEISSMLNYREIFGDNFYVELSTYPTDEQKEINKRLAAEARMQGIPLSVGVDAHFARPDQFETHDAYLAMQTKESVNLPRDERKMSHPKSLYLQTEQEVRNNLIHLEDDVVQEAIGNSNTIGYTAAANLPEIRRHLPVFVPGDCPYLTETKQTSRDLLLDLVKSGLEKRYGDELTEEIWDRATRELEAFLEADLGDYFLLNWDLCQYCEKQGIQTGPGRGSSAGSLVAYALGITDVDPIHYDLIFERFYNPGRAKGLPDIDIDFPREARRKVYTYLCKRWGTENVKTIGNISRLKPKAACDRTYAAFDIIWKEKEGLKAIIEKIPDLEIHGSDTIGWDESTDPGKSIYVMDHVGDEIAKWIGADKRKQTWVDFLSVVCSRVSQYGVHASGIVVSDVPLDAELPGRWATDPKLVVTQFPMSEIDERQFMKEDVLGLRNLDTLAEWESLTSQKGIEWSGKDKDPEWNTPEMWEMLDQGLGLGIFQVEDGYAKRLCKEFKPRSVDDLAAIVALNRPGPIRTGDVDHFLARRKGDEDIEYDHPILESILEPTYGVFVYQEQIIEFFTKLGYSLEDADAVRKILGKKKPEAMNALFQGNGEWSGKSYIDMAAAAGLHDGSSDILIWDKMVGFASYSFNRSHAIAYAVLGFRTLYAKWTDPTAYTIACIKTNAEKAGKYVAEAHRMGIAVLPPDIDESEVDIANSSGRVIFGFSNIKHIGKESARYLVTLKEKYDISSPEKLDKALEVESEIWKDQGNKGKSPRTMFKRNLITLLWDVGAWDKYEDREYSLGKRQEIEKEYLQVVLSDESEQVFQNNTDALDIEQVNEYSEIEEMATLRLPGVIRSIRETATKADKKAMGFINIEYRGEEAEFVVFPREWQRYKFLWKEQTAGIFELNNSSKGLSFEGGIKLT